MRLQSYKWSGGSSTTLSGTSEDKDERRKGKETTAEDQMVETEGSRSRKAVQSESAGKLDRSREYKNGGQQTVKASEGVLERTSGKKAPTDKETWWWNEEIQSIMRRKKTLKKVWDTSGEEEDRRRYQEAKNETKRAVAAAKNCA